MKNWIISSLIGITLTGSAFAGPDAERSHLRRIEIWPEKTSDTSMMVVEEIQPEVVTVSICSKYDASKCKKRMAFQGREEIPLFVIKSLVKDLKARPQADISVWDKIAGAAGLSAMIYGGVTSSKITSANSVIVRRPPTFTNMTDGFGIPVVINNNYVQTTLTKAQAAKRLQSQAFAMFGFALSTYEALNFVLHSGQAQLYLTAITLEYSPGFSGKGISIDFPMTETFDELQDMLKNVENNFS